MESPVMKAWREFALADPEDCDREYDAYLALVNKTGTASGSSPTSSTSPQLHSAPSAPVMAPSTTSSTTRLRTAASRVVLNTKHDLTLGARCINDYLVGSSSSSTPAASSRAQSSASITSGIPRSAAAATAPAEKDLHSVTTSTCSTVFLGDDKTMSPTSEAEAIYKLLIADRSVYDIQFAEYAEKYRASSCRSGYLPVRAPAPVAAQVAVAGHSTSAVSSTISAEGVLSALPSSNAPPDDLPRPLSPQISVVELFMRSPTTCSTECPCDDADASMSVDISSATPNSPMTTCGTVRELAALVVNDKALDVDVTGDASPTATICLPGDLDDCTGNKDSVNMSLTPGSAPALFVAPQVFEAMVPHMCLIKCSVKDTCVLMPKFHPPLGCPFTTAQGNVIHSDCTLLPWPSFKCGSFWTLLVRQVLSEQREGFPSLVALHIRAMSLQRFLVPFENHVRHKHDKVFLGVQQLRPPWQPPKVEIMDVHTQEAAGGWFHSLEIAGRILLHQLGKFMSSSSSITVKDTTSPCAKWCLDDLSWRFHKWWSVTHCVQLANAIVRDFFWPWITIKNVKVLSLFSCSPSLVNCHVAKEQFLLSDTAQMNVASYCEASLNWVVYCGYPSLNNSQPHSWILIIVGRLVQYGLEADALLRVISWLPVTFLQLFLGLFCVVQGYPSSIGFLTILHGEAAVQHHYTCTRVLTEAIRARWIYYHILQGNTHFSELKQWSCSHSILQPEFWFCTPGHILFICCALVQWKNPWTIRLVSLIFRFPCCHAERKYLYSRENFQWTIAWLFSCQRLEMTELTPWCSWELFPCIYVVTSCLLGAFHILTSSVVTLEGIYSTCSHYFEVQILDQICIMFSTSIILHAEELYHLRGLYSSCNQFLTEGAICFGSQHLEWKIPWYIAWLLVKPSCAHPNFGGTLIMHFPVETVGLHPTKVFCYCLLIQWPGVLICQRASFYATLQNAKHILGADIYGPNWQNNTKLKNPSCWNGWSFLLHIPEHFADPILLLGVLLLGRPVKFSGFDELKKFWDPGGVKLRLSETTFVLRPWDPGGSTWCRLEVKPNFKEGGLSATCLHERADGPPPWAIAYLEARCRRDTEVHIPRQRQPMDWAWNRRNGRRLRPRAGCRLVLRVCSFSPSSS